MVAVITSSTAPGNLGFNPFSAVKSVAKTAARVVTNPNVQRVATAAAGSYAPAQYAQVQQYAAQAQGYANRARAIISPTQPGVAVQMPAPAPDMPAPAPDGPPAKSGPGMFTLAAIGGGLVLVYLLTR